MAREIERKFLVRNDEWRRLVEGAGARIRQAYFFVGEDRSCRIRIIDETTARLTIKTGRGIDRGEFEYEIPLQDAEDLAAERIGSLIEKRRYRIAHGDHVVELDVFEGELAGLVLGEIELSSADTQMALPDYFGEEVTDNPAYTNARLALNGLPKN
ncbi:CYTH domain-containing protein [Fulvimarina manganoxydans]|uniref:CYTH domain-containing protein n=1 Tax=Fulvimarina manganoxydans TaxID=937218 RepID=A0A1W2BQM8_9HYPH|nr:CYTH domain-containing protein [Fulvimarina manganoxydans]SMC75024.1 CYTH domain-containing protein [Fulvimarina manganoxydans]